MPYTNTYISQVKASADSKLALRAYSNFLKRLYGMAIDKCSNVKKLLLLKFALDSWDNTSGATNVLSGKQLNNVIRMLEKA